MRCLLLILALWCGSARADDWTPEQRTLGAGYAALLLADCLQTRTIAHHPEQWREFNPLMGRHPPVARVHVHFIATALVAAVVLDLLPSNARTPALWFLTVAEAGVVGRNAYAGIRMSF